MGGAASSGDAATEGAGGGPPGSAGPPARLRRRVLTGSAWTVGGQGGQRVLRLGSNLILTRLLFPEAFGLVAIVNAVTEGLGLLADVGIGPSIIQDRRGEEPRFLNTAWTVQVVRGVGLWLLASALAWPLARLYEEPLLLGLLPVAALRAVVAGFNSTSLFTWSRRLELRRLTLVDLGSQATNVAATIALAWATRSVWALVLGGFAGAFLKLAWSHRASQDPPNRLQWDAEVARSIYRFGRWIFLATLLTFLTRQGDRLLLGAFLRMDELGQYAIASLLLQALIQTAQVVGNRVLFPTYARVGKTTGPALRRRVARVRIAVMGTLLPALCVCAVAGDRLVALLYDPRYAAAGWMLQMLGGGALFLAVGWIGPLHLARGESHVGLVATGLRAVVLLGGMTLGGWLAGTPGLVAGVASSYTVYYPVQVWISRRYGVWLPLYDLAGLALSAAVVAAGLAWL